jgi:antitoxin component YwqK of YwqJK toxin-antitoxin module
MRKYIYDAYGQIVGWLDSLFDTKGILRETDRYSKTGQLLERDDYNSVGKLADRVLYSYDTAGRMTSTSTYDAANHLIRSTAYSNGLIKSDLTYNAINGSIATDTEYASGKKSSYSTFDLFGNVSTRTLYDATGSVKEVDAFSYNSNLTLAKEIIRDGKGAIVEIDTFNYAGKVLTNVTKTNALNQVTEIDYYNPNGTLKSVWLPTPVTYSVSASLPTVGEGGTETFTLKTTGVAAGTQISYVLSGTNDALSLTKTGTLTVGNNGTASLTVAIPTNKITNDSGTLTFAVGNSSTTVTVTDTTVNPTPTPTPPTSSKWDTRTGWGEINVSKALSLVTGKTYTDTAGNLPWHLETTHFQTAWNAGYTGKGVIIADIDTGVDMNNPYISSRVLSNLSYNFVSNNTNVQDDNGHGTFTASELVGYDTANKIIGGAYDASLMVLKALDATGTGSYDAIDAAIIYAVDHGASVINMSLGGSSGYADMEAALKYANDHGVAVFCAAGNESASSPSYPAAYASQFTTVCAVGATTNNGATEAYFSNDAGSSTSFNYVDAPGVSVKGYSLNKQIGLWDGTSMATPLVAAAAAVLKSASPSTSFATIIKDLELTTSAVAAYTAGSSAASMSMMATQKDNFIHTMATLTATSQTVTDPIQVNHQLASNLFSNPV